MHQRRPGSLRSEPCTTSGSSVGDILLRTIVASSDIDDLSPRSREVSMSWDITVYALPPIPPRSSSEQAHPRRTDAPFETAAVQSLQTPTTSSLTPLRWCSGLHAMRCSSDLPSPRPQHLLDAPSNFPSRAILGPMLQALMRVSPC